MTGGRGCGYLSDHLGSSIEGARPLAPRSSPKQEVREAERVVCEAGHVPPASKDHFPAPTMGVEDEEREAKSSQRAPGPGHSLGELCMGGWSLRASDPWARGAEGRGCALAGKVHLLRPSPGSLLRPLGASSLLRDICADKAPQLWQK